MSERVSAYTVVELAAGSYDVLLDEALIAALTREIGGTDDEWRIDLLREMHPAECPPPFTAQSHTFISYQAALNWLGIFEVRPARVQRSVSARQPQRSTPRYRAHPTASEHYHLRLLAKRNRFYRTMNGLNGLIWREFIAPTGLTDDDGRAEYMITKAGRAALAEVEV